jgi:hypothetical protein
MRASAALRRLLVAAFVNNIGNGAYTLGAALLLYQLTGRPAAVGLLFAAEFVLGGFGQAVAGSLVDRRPAPTVAAVTDLVRGSAVLGAAAVVAIHPSVLPVVLATVVLNLAKPLYRIATFSLSPAVAGGGAPVALVNALRASAIQSGQIIGVAVAGLVFAFVNPLWTFVVNGLSFLASAALVAGLPAPRAAAGRVGLRAVRGDWAALLRLVRKGASLRSHLLLGASGPAIVAVVNVVIVPLVVVRGGPNWQLSVLDGAFALGAVTSARLVPSVVHYGPAVVARIGLLVMSVAYAGLALIPSLTAAAVCLAVLGAATTLQIAVVNAALQERAGAAARGRVGGLLDVSVSLVGALTLFAATAAVNRYGVIAAALAVAAALLAFAGAVVVLSRTPGALTAPLSWPDAAVPDGPVPVPHSGPGPGSPTRTAADSRAPAPAPSRPP